MEEHPSSWGGGSVVPFPESAFGFDPPALDPDWVTEVPTFWHNCVAHPLLWLLRRWPTAAEWVHNRTEPTVRRRTGRG